MILAAAIGYVAILLLCGYALTGAILGAQRRGVEFAALTLLLGPGASGIILIWLSLLGLKPDRIALAIIGASAATLIIVLARFGRFPAIRAPRLILEDSPARSLMLIGLLAGLLLANALAAVPAVGLAQFDWDAIAIWAFKAKVLHETALGPARPQYFSDVTLSFTHLDYPLLLPMLLAGAYGIMGQIHEQAGKLVLPVLFGGQTLLACAAARHWLPRLHALVAALLLMGAPFAIRAAGTGTADSALTGFYLGSIFYLARWASQTQRRDAVLCALFSAMLVMTKVEGLGLAGINVLILIGLCLTAAPALRRRAWICFMVFALLLGGCSAIWLGWQAGIPHTHDNYLSRLRWNIVIGNLHRLKQIVPAMLESFTDVLGWGGLWIVLPIMALLGWRALARRDVRVLWALLIGHLSLYALAYVITDWDLEEILTVTLYRLLLHATPAAMLLIAAHWSALEGCHSDAKVAIAPKLRPT